MSRFAAGGVTSVELSDSSSLRFLFDGCSGIEYCIVLSSDISGASPLMGDIAGVVKGEVVGSPFFSGVDVTTPEATSLDLGVLSSLDAGEFSRFEDDRGITGCANAFLIASDNLRLSTNFVIPKVSPKFCSSSVFN